MMRLQLRGREKRVPVSRQAQYTTMAVEAEGHEQGKKIQ